MLSKAKKKLLKDDEGENPFYKTDVNNSSIEEYQSNNPWNWEGNDYGKGNGVALLLCHHHKFSFSDLKEL